MHPLSEVSTGQCAGAACVPQARPLRDSPRSVRRTPERRLGASEALIVPNDIDAALSDPRVLWTEDILRFADTDALGHINNTTFSVLCESGRVHLLASRINPTLPAGVFS